MDTPKNLSHKPIISVINYDKIDANNSSETDAKAISIGLAQYDSSELSLKVWRHTGQSWSRQSEELPLHRNLDLSILLVSAMLPRNINYSNSVLREEVDDESQLNFLKLFMLNNEEHLKPRLKELYRLIDEYLTK